MSLSQLAIIMESSSKRRKIDHVGPGLRHHGLVDFESRSTATTFVLQTDQLLNEARLNYTKALKGVDHHLFRLKEILDAIEPHEPVSVRFFPTLLGRGRSLTPA